MKEIARTPAVLSMLSKWRNWDEFDIFELNRQTSGHPLAVLCHHLLSEMGMISRFQLNEEALARFLLNLEDGYRDITYHNNIHAADVMHSVAYYMLNCTETQPSSTCFGLTKIFKPEDFFYMLLAAAMHDFRHPGFTNSYLVNSGSDLAVTYNDVSVLEHMHCSEAFQLLKQTELDFMGNFDRAAKSEFRTFVVEAILGTDMKFHFATVAEMVTWISTAQKANESKWFQPNANAGPSIKDRLFFCKVLVHLADISTPARPLPIVLEWTERLFEEFYNQGDEEKRLGLPISMLCNRETDNIPKGQIGFYEFVVKPMFVKMLPILPCAQKCIDQLTANRDYWKGEAARELKEAEEAETKLKSNIEAENSGTN